VSKNATAFVPRTSVDYWRTRYEIAEVEIGLLTERAAHIQYSLTLAENEIAALKAKPEKS